MRFTHKDLKMEKKVQEKVEYFTIEKCNVITCEYNHAYKCSLSDLLIERFENLFDTFNNIEDCGLTNQLQIFGTTKLLNGEKNG